MGNLNIDKSILIEAMEKTAEGVAISDAQQPDNPLVFVNEGFEKITGYKRYEIIGKNCRFLQGPDTNEEATKVIRAALREGKHCVVELINHRKDGSRFWNRLSINPLKDDSGKITHFVGIQSDITEAKKLEETLTALTNAFLVYFGNQENSYERTLDDLNKIIAQAELAEENRERLEKLKKLIQTIENAQA
ncbi:MAG: PAS domain-containing protein [Chlorobiales bacterium]|nr:PAS domain-containing protein [Chlorobiales bacterium]